VEKEVEKEHDRRGVMMSHTPLDWLGEICSLHKRAGPAGLVGTRKHDLSPAGYLHIYHMLGRGVWERVAIATSVTSPLPKEKCGASPTTKDPRVLPSHPHVYIRIRTRTRTHRHGSAHTHL
jgi:hypothetical protein